MPGELIDGCLILNLDGTVKRPKSEKMTYDGNEYPVLELLEVANIVATKGKANIIEVTVNGDDIISANLILGMELKQNPPEPQKDITITFTAFTEEDSKA